jgi:hypothetical protein
MSATWFDSTLTREYISPLGSDTREGNNKPLLSVFAIRHCISDQANRFSGIRLGIPDFVFVMYMALSSGWMIASTNHDFEKTRINRVHVVSTRTPNNAKLFRV